MLPESKIVQKNGALGIVAPAEDGIAALVMGGVAVADKIALGEVKIIYSLQEAVDLGLDADYDTTNTVVVHEHIKDFFAEAGDGSELHIMLVAQATTMEQMLDKANAYAQKVLADGEGNVKLLAVAANPIVGYVPVVADGFDDDVWAAAAKAKELRESEFSLFRYCSFIIEGRGFAGNAATAKDLRDAVNGPDANRVHICIQAHPDVYARGGQVAKYAAVGLMLGAAAANPVQRNIGRVKNGAVSWTKAGLSSAAALSAYTDVNLAVLNDKGYIFLRKHTGKAGFFFNDDHAACPVTDDYNSLTAGRVMDKASSIIRQLYLENVLDDIELDPNTGRMMPAVIKAYQASAENAISAAMQRNGEISGVRVIVDPAQDVQTTNEVKAEISLVRKGIAKTLTSTLSYTKSLNS